ncbi:MAG: DUF177 domain-containing protein [Rhodospirillales bacterium]|nr:DUF177 domain-containing protein [Rhodospirillales bacterium]
MKEIQPEFSRPVAVRQLGPGETSMEIQADSHERDALAKRFGLVSLERLVAEVRLRPVSGSSLVRLRGRFEADVVQQCGVTLDEVRSHLDETFELAYAPPEGIEREALDIMVTLDEADPPEPIRNGVIDTGEAVAEHLALALDPFPRAPGAALKEDRPEAEEEGREPRNPFAALEALKRKPD